MNARNRTSGRYTWSIEQPCTCGHRLGEHTAERAGDRQDCLADGCACLCFMPAAPSQYQPGYATRDGNTHAMGATFECLRSAEQYVASFHAAFPDQRATFITDGDNPEAGDVTERECECSGCVEYGQAWERGDEGEVTR